MPSLHRFTVAAIGVLAAAGCHRTPTVIIVERTTPPPPVIADADERGLPDRSADGTARVVYVRDDEAMLAQIEAIRRSALSSSRRAALYGDFADRLDLSAFVQIALIDATERSVLSSTMRTDVFERLARNPSLRPDAERHLLAVVERSVLASAQRTRVLQSLASSPRYPVTTTPHAGEDAPPRE